MLYSDASDKNIQRSSRFRALGLLLLHCSTAMFLEGLARVVEIKYFISSLPKWWREILRMPVCTKYSLKWELQISAEWLATSQHVLGANTCAFENGSRGDNNRKTIQA